MFWSVVSNSSAIHEALASGKIKSLFAGKMARDVCEATVGKIELFPVDKILTSLGRLGTQRCEKTRLWVLSLLLSYFHPGTFIS